MATLVKDSQDILVANDKKEYSGLHFIITNAIASEAFIMDELIVDAVYVCYTFDPLKFGNNLANRIADGTDLSVILKTTLSRREFQIVVNFRLFVTIYSIGVYAGKPIPELMKFDEVDINDVTYKQFPKFIRSIPKIWDMYRVENHANWDLAKEECPRKIIGGGGEIDLSKFGGDVIIIGMAAVNHYMKTKFMDRSKRLVSSSCIDYIKNAYPKAKVVRYDLGISLDWRLYRYLVYLDGRQVLELYNALDYELIGAIRTQNGWMAHPYVVAKFMLIEYYMTVIAGAADIIHPNIVKRREQEITNAMGIIKEGEKYPLEKLTYFGEFVEISYARNREMVSKMFPPYNPRDYKKANGQYRLL
jgi:hypothetical protein